VTNSNKLSSLLQYSILIYMGLMLANPKVYKITVIITVVKKFMLQVLALSFHSFLDKFRK